MTRDVMLTHPCKLQSVEGAGGRGGYPEVPGGCYPGLQGLQLASCQVGSMVLDQVALELVRLEIKMD